MAEIYDFAKSVSRPFRARLPSPLTQGVALSYYITHLRCSKGNHVPQSLSSILVHLVFSTKNREAFIVEEVEPELHKYMAWIFKALKSPSLIIGGTDDHVHALFALSRTITVADLVEEVKTSSSKWIKTKGSPFRQFHWQAGYGAFSIGQSNVNALKRYIATQREHHHRKSFQDEFRSLCRKYGVDIDERYVWD